VVVDATDHRFLGAERHSNNTAELSAMVEAFTWLNTEAPDEGRTPAVLVYDSRYAAEAVRHGGVVDANAALVEAGREAVLGVAQSRALRWIHVYGHARRGYDHGNWWADRVAAWGALQQVGPDS